LVRTVVGWGEQTDPAADLDCGTCDDWEQASHNGDLVQEIDLGSG
jgi:hypothetical protein